MNNYVHLSDIKSYSAVHTSTLCSRPHISDIQFGVTWKDDELVAPEEIVQSFFLSLRTRVNFLGIDAKPGATVDVRFMNAGEFNRRQNYNRAVCCVPEKGIEDCNIPNSRLEDLFLGPKFDPAPTLGVFVALQDFSEGGKCTQ